MTIKDELNEFRQGLLGFTSKLSSTPKKVHSVLDTFLARYYMYNKRLQEVQTKASLLGHETTNQNQLAESLDKKLHGAREKNHDLKQEEKSEHRHKPPGHRR